MNLPSKPIFRLIRCLPILTTIPVGTCVLLPALYSAVWNDSFRRTPSLIKACGPSTSRGWIGMGFPEITLGLALAQSCWNTLTSPLAGNFEQKPGAGAVPTLARAPYARSSWTGIRAIVMAHRTLWLNTFLTKTTLGDLLCRNLSTCWRANFDQSSIRTTDI